MKELLKQALDALLLTDKLSYPGRNAVGAAIAALQAALDAPEPYDQTTLELCEVCGWKAIIPGEPCLMCERNAKMLQPEPVPVGWLYDWHDDFDSVAKDWLSTDYEEAHSPTMGCHNIRPLYTHPETIKESLMIESMANACKGKNCGSTNPKLHSAECFEEHDIASGGEKAVGYVRHYAIQHLSKPGHTVINHEPQDTSQETPDVALYTRPAVPLTRQQVKSMMDDAGYSNLQERADFINGIRHAELAHGIKPISECSDGEIYSRLSARDHNPDCLAP